MFNAAPLFAVRSARLIQPLTPRPIFGPIHRACPASEPSNAKALILPGYANHVLTYLKTFILVYNPLLEDEPMTYP